MKMLLVLAAAALVGCAGGPKTVTINTPTKPDFTKRIAPVASFDGQCADLAKITKSVALMRDAGVSADDITLMVKIDENFPIQPLIREVYSRKDISPIDGQTNSYAVCQNVTYDKMIGALFMAAAAMNQAEQSQLAKRYSDTLAINARQPVTLKMSNALSTRVKK